MYTLSNLADQGHVYATKEQLIKTAAELLEAEEGCVVMTLDQMLADHDLILQKVEIPEEQRKHEMPADLEQPEWKLAESQITRSYLSAAVLLCGDRCGRKIKRLLAAPAADRLWTALETAKEKQAIRICRLMWKRFRKRCIWSMMRFRQMRFAKQRFPKLWC